MVIFVGESEPGSWQFRLGSIFFNTGNEPDDLGCLWTMPEPDGWESPAVRVNPVDIPYDDGQDIGDVYFQARTIHATGEIICTLPGQAGVEGLEKAKSRLLQETRLLRQDGQFVGRDSTGTFYANCRRGDRTVFPTRAGPEATTFDFVLIAADPYKYALAPTVVQVNSTTLDSGGLTVPWRAPLLASPDISSSLPTQASHNLGDLDADFTAEFVGPLTNPKLIDRVSGMRIEVAASIPVGRSITVDTKYRSVMEDVTPAYGVLTSSTTPLDQMFIPAGGACAWLLLGQGSGHVLVTHNDTKE